MALPSRSGLVNDFSKPVRAPALAGNSLFVRLLLAIVILLGEYFSLKLLLHDVASVVSSRAGVWDAAAWIVLSEDGGTAGLIAALAGLLALGLILEIHPPASAIPAVRRCYLALHAPFVLAFFGTTWLMFGTPNAPPGPAGIWLVLWILLGLSSTLLLLAGLFGTLVRSAKVAVVILVASLAAGCVAWKLGEWSQQLWKPLGYATLTSTAGILRLGFDRVSAEPRHFILGLNDFWVEIDPNCSGFEGMGLMAVVISVYVLLFRKELVFPNAWLLLAIGAVGAWIGNLVRLCGLMIFGAYVNPDVALGGFHSNAGWVLFCSIALVVGHIGRRSSLFVKVAERRDSLAWNPTAIYLLPLFALLATGLVTGMFTDEVDQLYGLRIVSALIVLLLFRRRYPVWAFQISFLALLSGVLVGAAWLIIPSSLPDPPLSAAMSHNANPAWLIVRALGSITVVPLCEELAFRGFLLRWFVSRDFTSVAFRTWTPIAVVGSSLAFGALHQRWILGVFAGFVYAVVQIRKGSTWDAVVAHAVSNAAIAAYVVMSGDFSHWG